LVEYHFANNTLSECQLVETSEPLMLPSIKGTGAMLGEGMGAAKVFDKLTLDQVT